LTISLIVFAGWGAEGPLSATLMTAVLFFFTSIYALRKDVVFGINKFHLKEALRYSLPLVPHSLASQISNAIGKRFLNYLVNTGSAGLYNIGFMFGSIIGVISDGINKAYVPISMGILSTNREKDLDHLKNIVLFLVVMYCLLGAVISLFSKEAIFILTTEAFYRSYVIVPFLAFYFVLGGIYYILVNILFFVKKATKYVALGTGIGATSNILLSWFLIPPYGLFGAAMATMLAQIIGTLFIGFIGYKFEIIRWEYRKYFFIFILSAIFSFSHLILKDLDLCLSLGIKTLVFAILFLLLNIIAWGDPFFLLTHGKKLALAMIRGR